MVGIFQEMLHFLLLRFLTYYISVQLECEAGGKPSPEITWIHNGKPLEKAVVNPRRKLVGNRIIIENAKKADTGNLLVLNQINKKNNLFRLIGNYGCNASNFFGYVYKDVYVNVLGKLGFLL